MTMDYFDILVVKGGVIGWILWIMNFAVCAMIIENFVNIRRDNILPADVFVQLQELVTGKHYREAIDLTSQETSFLSEVINAGLTESPHGYGAMQRAMEEASEGRITRMLRHIEWLNLIGNIAPMLGLLGTVWGMINAFFTIVQAGGMPDPGSLANSIGIALVTTLLGLNVAIWSLAFYSVMRHRIDALCAEAMVASQELVTTFRPGVGK